ncbi:hypothetical protein Tco_0393942 [Tanacetum coccineum]
MTGNMSYLTHYEEIDEGYVALGGNPKGGKLTGKGTIKTDNLDFENVYFFPNFKLIDEIKFLLRVPRKNNMYSVDLKNIVPKRGLTCLFKKATSDESKLWHRRLGIKSNGFVGTKASDNAGQARKETEYFKNYILLPLWHADPPFSQDPKSSQDDGSKPSSDDEKKVDEDPRKDCESIDQEKDDNVNNTNNVNDASTNEVNYVGGKTSIKLSDDLNMPEMEKL